MNEGFVDGARGASTDSAPASLFGKKLDESKGAVSPKSLPVSGQNLVDSDLSTATMRESVPESASKAAATAAAAAAESTLHSSPNIFTLGRTSTAASPISSRPASDLDKTDTSWPPSQQLRSCSTTDCNKMAEQELTIESGTINISTVYSQG